MYAVRWYTILFLLFINSSAYLLQGACPVFSTVDKAQVHNTRSHENAFQQRHSAEASYTSKRILAVRLQTLNHIANNVSVLGACEHNPALQILLHNFNQFDWQTVISPYDVRTLFNALSFWQYPLYRLLLKKFPEYSQLVAQSYLDAQCDQVLHDRWSHIPLNAYEYFEKEGKAALMHLEIARTKTLLENKKHDKHLDGEQKKRADASLKALKKATKNSDDLVYGSHVLPFYAQQALRDVGIPLSAFTNTAGTPYHHAIQDQACQLVSAAAYFDDTQIIEREAIFEAAYDSIVASEGGSLYRAQEIIDAGYELQREIVSQEASLRYVAKAVELCADFGVGFGKGVVLGALRTIDLLRNPGQLAKGLYHVLSGLAKGGVAVTEHAVDIVLFHLPGVSNDYRLSAATRILERKKACVQGLEKVIDYIQNMSAEDAGILVGSVAFDVATAKPLASVGCMLLSRTKGVLEVVKKAEGVVKVTSAVSQRYQKTVQKLKSAGKTFEKRVERILNSKEITETVVAGTDTKVAGSVFKAKAEQIVGGGKLAESTKISLAASEVKPVIRTVKETGEQCRIVRPLDAAKAESEWCYKKYSEIRESKNDVIRIAHNTGMKESKIQKIKNHLFFDEHKKRHGIIGRFDPDAEIAAAWDRLYKGDYINNDIKLLKHEYFELKYKSIFKTDYDMAHKAAQHPFKGSPWGPPKFEDF